MNIKYQIAFQCILWFHHELCDFLTLNHYCISETNPNWCRCVFKSVLLTVSILILLSESRMCFYCFLSHLSDFGIAIRKKIGNLQKKTQKPTQSNVCVFVVQSSVVSDFWQLCGLKHARLPSPSPTPRIRSNSGSFSRWCRPTISSSVVPFSSCL